MGHIHKVAFPGSIGNAECIHVGVLHRYSNSVLFVAGVYVTSTAPILAAGIEEGQPVAHCWPRYPRYCLFLPYGHQAFGKIVDPFVKLLPCEGKLRSE